MIIKIEDCLSEEDFILCKNEIDRFSKIFEETDRKFAKYKRFIDLPHFSKITPTIEPYIFSNKIKEEVKNEEDLAWRLFANDKINKFETQVTYYDNGDFYDWHYDHTSPYYLTHNFILYMTDEGEKYKGGYLEIEPDKKIKPKKNTLILMPSYYKHRVTKVKSTVSTSIWDKRVTINGHLRIL